MANQRIHQDLRLFWKRSTKKAFQTSDSEKLLIDISIFQLLYHEVKEPMREVFILKENHEIAE
jgi:hypothetical protein